MASTTILCLGDSHTRGFYGSDWVSMLQRELPSARLVRRGVDGQLARNIAARCPAALADAAANSTLAGVVLFCGTNDTLCASSAEWRQLHERTTKFVKPGEACSPDTFEASVRQMIELVVGAGGAAAAGAAAQQQQTRPPPPPRIALVTLPPLDEHDMVDGPNNNLVREHNSRLVKLAAEFPTSVTLVDLFALLYKALASAPPPPRPAAVAATIGPHQPKAMVRGEMVGLARRWLLRQPWDKIADANGGLMLTDRIHLSDRAGQVLAEALRPWAAEAASVAAAGSAR
jgi:lysophospholipase L1-like esterase